MHRWPLLALALAACTGEPTEILADYTLTIQPRVPGNQSPFDGGAAVKVVFYDDVGGVTIDHFGDIESGNVSRENQPPLSAERIGLLLEEPGGPSDSYDPTRVVAYGEVDGPFDLGTGAEEVHATVFTPMFGAVGELGELPTGATATAAGIAITSKGTVYIAGGSLRITAGDEVRDEIVRMVDLDEGDWTFETVANLPQPATGTVVETVDIDGEEHIFILGGRNDLEDRGPYYDTAMLLHAETAEVVWTGNARYSHAHSPVAKLQNGTLVIATPDLDDEVGSAFDNPEVELWVPSNRDSAFDGFQRVNDPIGAGTFGCAIAASGNRALLCGGGEYSGGGSGLLGHAECDWIDGSANATPGPSLDVIIQFHAMTTLTDGRILLAGGLPNDVPNWGTGPATDLAYLLDPGNEAAGWEQVGRLNEARAGFKLIPTNDGRAIAVGGADGGSWYGGATGEPVTCAELFDPATGQWTPMEPCGFAGQGLRTSAAWHPDQGAVVLEGLTPDGRGGRFYGIIGLGPNF